MAVTGIAFQSKPILIPSAICIMLDSVFVNKRKATDTRLQKEPV